MVGGGYQRIPLNDEVEEVDVTEQIAEEDAAGYISKALFSWVSPMINTGYERALEISDLLMLVSGDTTDSLARRWNDAWSKELELSETWKPYIGSRVSDDDDNHGTLRWLGRLQLSVNPDSYYAGVEWDETRRHVDKNGNSVGGDGWYYSEKIFNCSPGRGSFIKPHLLKVAGTDALPPRTPFVGWGLSRAFLKEVLVAGLFKFFNDFAIFVGPLVLKAVIKFLKKDDAEWGEGIMLVSILFSSQIVQSLCMNQYFFLNGRVGMRMKQSLCAAVFDKSLTISERSRAHPELNIGRIVNLMATDSQRASDVCQNMHQIWSAPLQIIVCCVLIYQLVGPSLFAGIGVMMCATPIQTKIMRKMMTVREQMVKHTDERVKSVSEVMGGIKIIKFMVWTQKVADAITGIRMQEVDKLATQQNYRVIMFFIIYLTPLFLTASTFIVYAAGGGAIEAEIVFPALSLFSILRFPFLILPMQFNTMVNAKISFDRLTLFLESPATRITAVPSDDPNLAFSVEDASFVAYEPSPLTDLAPVDVQLDPNSSGIPEATSVTVKSPKPTPKKDKSVKYKVSDRIVLKDINVSIKKGELTMIVGLTGSGKSCLSDAMLGHIDTSKGVVKRSGVTSNGVFRPDPVAYVAQQSWIKNATLKENIIFQEPLDELWYQRVIDSCQLAQDVTQLQNGDQTEIGEKGINLSGGQKQRVSIARAVYSRKDTVLLDDPLSAVDPHVAKQLMKRVIGSNLRTRPEGWGAAELDGFTRVLVTHQIQFLKHADNIIFVKDGTVQAQFSNTESTTAVDELMKYSGPGAEFFTPVHQAAKLKQEKLEQSANQPPKVLQPKKSPGLGPSLSPKVSPKSTKAGGKLTTTEERAQGNVSSHVYLAYIKAAGGWKWFFFAMVLFILNQGCLQACDLWLTWWTDSVHDASDSDSSTKGAPLGNGLSNMQHLFVYTGLIGLTSIFNLCRGFTVYSRFQAASRYFHVNLLRNVLRAPMSFFDTTPLGRLLNRFSKDIDQVDVVLPPTVVTFFQLSLATAASFAIIATSQPLLLAVMFPSVFVYVRILKRFIRSNRETKRLDSISKSPIFQHFTETLNGLKTIASYDCISEYQDENRSRVDVNTRTTFSNLACNRWLAIRLELLGNFICALTVMLAVVSKLSFHANNSSVGLLSLGITYSLSITQQLNFLVRQISDLEAQMNGVERIVEYTEDIDQEPILQYSPDKTMFKGKQLLHSSDDRLAIVRRFNEKESTVTIEIPTEDRTTTVPINDSEYSRTSAPPLPKSWPCDVCFHCFLYS